MELLELLNSKPLYYTKFDPNRIVEAYELIKDKIKHPKAIWLIGTNGKGSTGRAVAHLSYKSGLSVGHFTSPHILDFKERFWIDGRFATKDELQKAHKKLSTLLGKKITDALSYFEYQTLLAFVLFEDTHLQVIEAGLGGEYDATSVKKYDLTIITPIGFDHSTFLGKSIKEIATTKLNAISKKVLIANQEYKEVYTIAKEIATIKGSKLYFYKDLAKERFKEIQKLSTKKAWPNYIIQNITNAILALDIMQINYSVKDLKTLSLFGRFYKIAPNIIIDVGHNPLAAKAIVEALPKKVTLIFNILGDKEYKEVLEILKPKIKELQIIKIDNQRALDLKELENFLEKLEIKYSYFNTKLEKNKEYLVFGSFFVVEQFLKTLKIKSIEEFSL